MAKTNKKTPIIVENRPPEKSPMLIIQQKEVEINSGILMAKRQAEETVAKARMKAVEIREQAEKEGARLATELNKKEVAKAKKEAEKTRASAPAASAGIREIGRKNAEKAVTIIINAVRGRSN